MKVVVLNECLICKKLYHEHDVFCPRCGSDKSEFVTARIVGNVIEKRVFQKNGIEKHIKTNERALPTKTGSGDSSE